MRVLGSCPVIQDNETKRPVRSLIDGLVGWGVIEVVGGISFTLNMV